MHFSTIAQNCIGHTQNVGELWGPLTLEGEVGEEKPRKEAGGPEGRKRVKKAASHQPGEAMVRKEHELKRVIGI